MNVDSLLHLYFPGTEKVCIEMFDDKNIQQEEEFEVLFLDGRNPELDELW